jgi:hypothetical protein
MEDVESDLKETDIKPREEELGIDQEWRLS